MNSSEGLDEEMLKVDPLEEGIEPPEQWSEADRFGTTLREQKEGEGLDERLREEQADVSEPDETVDPASSKSTDVLDETVDERTDDIESVAPNEGATRFHSGLGDDAPNADEAGDSVADAIRRPHSHE